jgi:hypothetical protein
VVETAGLEASFGASGRALSVVAGIGFAAIVGMAEAAVETSGGVWGAGEVWEGGAPTAIRLARPRAKTPVLKACEPRAA